MNWSEELSVGVSEIDDQHKRLILLINTLHDAMLAKQGKQAVSGILDELASYTVYHFKTEEQYMEKFGYPAYQSHRLEHGSFIQSVDSFMNDYSAGKLGLSIDIMNFLRDWVSNHIKGTDKKYSAFFREKGLQ